MTPLIDARVIQGHFQLWHKILDFRVYLLTCFHPSVLDEASSCFIPLVFSDSLLFSDSLAILETDFPVQIQFILVFILRLTKLIRIPLF